MPKKRTVLKLIRQGIRSHNKYMSTTHLKKLSPIALLSNVHPLYRKQEAYKLLELGMITQRQYNQYQTT